jgi:hypothetical protein
MNLTGVIVPGERTHALPGRAFVFSTRDLEERFQLPSQPRQRMRRAEPDVQPMPVSQQNRNQQIGLF